MTKLVVGLGNPGAEYQETRHNVGWMALDRLIERWKASGPKIQENGQVWTASVAGQKILLAKPMTYMNLSGRCVGALFRFYKCQPEDLIVIHDEMDLPVSVVRIKIGGGSGGHNGIKSIDASLGAEQTGYYRVRMGIGKPQKLEDGRKSMDPADYVLSPFRREEKSDMGHLLDEVDALVGLLIEGRSVEAMNRFHRKSDE